MTTKTTKLKPLPKQTPAEAIEALEKAEDWTEQPARDAAADIAPNEPVAPPRSRRRASPRAAAAKPAKAPKTALPWADIDLGVTRGPVKLANFKLPPDLYKELAWFAGTTFGYTQTRIVIEGLRIRLDQMRKERGLK